MTVEKTAVNPVSWSMALGFDQGVLVQGGARTLHCSGQTATDAAGEPQHEGALGAQLALALDNLEAVLVDGGMALGDLVRLDVYCTDVDRLMGEYGVLAARLAVAGSRPATTVLGVTRLAVPGLLVELSGTAVA